MKLRSDYRAAVIMKDRLHNESGEPIQKPIHPSQQRRIRRRTRNFLRRLPVQRSNWSTYDPWSGWWIWRCWSTPRAHTTSRRWRICSSGMDPRKNEDQPSTWSQGHESFGTFWFWWTEHPHTRIFSHSFHPCSHAPHDSRCCSTCLCKKSAHPHVITCLIVRCLSTHWSLHLFRVSLHLVRSLHLLYSAHPPCGRTRPSTTSPVHPQNEEYCPVAIQNPLTSYELKQLDNFDNSETCTAICQNESVDIDTEPSYSCDAELDEELVRKALSFFTTVHSGARRTSEPETSISLFWRKFVASSFLFRTHKYGETRIRTKFRFVSKTETKSRPGKRANQDSPWKTKRGNSCWS